MRRLLAWLAGVALIGCVGDSTSTDGGTDATTNDVVVETGMDAAAQDVAMEAAKEAGPACNTSMPFRAPVLVPGVNTASNEISCSLSPDELDIYWLGPARRGRGGFNLFYANRASALSTFGVNTQLTALDAPPSNELSIFIYPNQLTVIFDSDRPGGLGKRDLYLATRASPLVAFSAPGNITALNSSGDDKEAYLTGDGTQIFFGSTRAGGTVVNDPGDIWEASATGSSFGTPTNVSEINTPFWEAFPVLSSDGLTIYWASLRTDGGALGGFDIWTATRASESALFANPATVPSLNTAQDDVPTWLSADGCHIYLYSARPGIGEADLYVASRPQ